MRSLMQIIRDDLTKEEKASLREIEDQITFSLKIVRQAELRLEEQRQRKRDFIKHKQEKMGMAV